MKAAGRQPGHAGKVVNRVLAGMMTMPVRTRQLAWVLASCMAWLLPAAAPAAELGYTYAEAGYARIDYDDYGDGNGFMLGGSYALNANFHAVGGYERADLDHGADYSAFNIGLGANVPLRYGLDVVARARFISADVDRPGDDDETGFSLEGMLRALVGPRLELNGGIAYEDVFDSNTALKLGAVYEIARNVSVVTGLDVSSDVTRFNLGLRLYFQPRGWR